MMRITKYFFYILVITFIWGSAYSPALAKPQSPKNVKTTYRTTRSVYVTLKNVPFSTKSQFKYYRLRILRNNKVVKSKELAEGLDKKRTGLVIHGLKPNSHYTVQVRTVTNRGTSRWSEKNFRTGRGQNATLKPEIVDMLAHANVNNVSANVEDIIAILDKWNISHQVLAPTPGPLEGFQNGNQASAVVEFIGEDTDNLFSVMYGGVKLNPILHALGGEHDITETEVFPNGALGDVSQALLDTQAIVDDPTVWENRFRSRATEAAQSGNYVGFGELSPLHFSYYSGHPSITFPADHELMLWLSDLAAEYNMVLLIHLEPTTGKLQQLENLLAHNRDTKIIWDHIGWYQTDLARPGVYKNMLEENENLYMYIKMRDETPYSAHRPIKRDGTLRSAWRTLFTSYSDRIMLSSDEKYWDDNNYNMTKSSLRSVEPLQQLYDQLPTATAQAVARDTAATLLQLE